MKSKLNNNYVILFLCIFVFGYSHSQSQVVTLDLNTKIKIADINPDMYGIFFEDINLAADGGLYAEMIKNRSFDFPQSPLMGWLTYGEVTVQNQSPAFERNPTYLRIKNTKPRKGAGLISEGFRGGLAFKIEETYKLSFYARNQKNLESQIQVEIINSNSGLVKDYAIIVNSPDWKKYSIELQPGINDARAKLRINLKSEGVIDIDHISLFPKNTFKGRENGLRNDLATALRDLKPGIMRFPGGCIIEGNSLATRYNWKNSVGPVENRPVNENRWNYTFNNRFTPDYWQSYGLGFYEFFQFCEDIGASPLPVISCGMACNFESKEKVPLDSLESYIQDALDLIEFANGSITSTWGKLRGEMGRIKPFNLRYLAIGNEQFDLEYPKYLEKFIKAIRSKYPEIKIIGSAGPYPDGKEFDFLWPEMNRKKADLVDEHYYRDPKWFINAVSRYDNYDRKGAKVFAGEYACHVKDRKNSFYSALCEAAFMTGLERNSDIVRLATYAPLLAHVDGWQWKPDMIWFDNMSMVKSANYYVQKLYGNYSGTYVVPLTIAGKAITGQNNLFASAVIDENHHTIILKIAYLGEQEQEIKIQIPDIMQQGEFEIKHILLKGPLNEENTLDQPDKIIPTEHIIKENKKAITVGLKPTSFNVLIINQ